MIGGNFPGTETWRARRARTAHSGRPTYDAYPDTPSRARVRLVLLSGKFMEQVDLDGLDPDMIEWSKGWRQRWLTERVVEAYNRLARRVNADRDSRNTR